MRFWLSKSGRTEYERLTQMGDLILKLALLALTLVVVGVVAVCVRWLLHRCADVYRFAFHDGKQKLRVDSMKGIAESKSLLFVFELTYQIKLKSLLDLLFVRKSLKIEALFDSAVQMAVREAELDVSLGAFEEYIATKILAQARPLLAGMVALDIVDIVGVKLISITPTEPTKLDNQPAPEAGE